LAVIISRIPQKIQTTANKEIPIDRPNIGLKYPKIMGESEPTENPIMSIIPDTVD
jgi:hypothetical protein